MEKLREDEGVPHARAAAAAEPCLVEVETSERDVAHEDQTRRDVAHAW
jgi:hypothetical protein